MQSQSQELLDAASDASIPRSIPDAAVAMQAMMGFQAPVPVKCFLPTDFVVWDPLGRQIHDVMAYCVVLVRSVSMCYSHVLVILPNSQFVQNSVRTWHASVPTLTTQKL